MTKYVWTAKDEFGTPVVKEIMADTIEESKSRLLAEGCTDLILIGDEVMAAGTAAMSHSVTFLGEELKVTEADKIKHMNRPAPTFARVLWQGINQSKGLIILILAIAVYVIYLRHWIALIFVGLGLGAWLAFLIGVSLPSIYYRRLHEAADWARWKEVLEVLDRLKKIEKVHFIKIPAPELGRYRAKALAGLGQLPQALTEYSRFENQSGCPSWLFKAFLAGIYDTAGQHEKAVDYTWQSIREKPTPVIYLDLANRYLRYLKDPIKAREALIEAEKITLPDMAKPFHLRCRGIMAFLEEDYVTARRELEASLEIMEKSPHLPYRAGHISIAKAFLCPIFAKLGDPASARKKFAEAELYLIATSETELIEQCKAAMRDYPGSGR